MVWLAIFLQGIGFYCVYNCSQRAALNKDKFSVWLQHHRSVSMAMGLSLLTSSFVFFVISQGLGVGILKGSVILMATSSSIILLSPIKSHLS